MIDDIDGSLKIRKMQIHGHLNQVRKMKYDGVVSTEGLTIAGALLPDKIRIRSPGARISHDGLVLPESQIDMAGRQLTLEADLSHLLWQNFKGSLIINGIVGEKIARWVKIKGWLPPRFFPNVPCSLAPLRIAWNEKEISLKGKILPGRKEKSGVTSRLDLTLSEDRLDLKELFISSLDETVKFWFCLDRGQHPCLKGGFSGSLKKETLDVLLENNQFLTGAVSGDCQMEYNFDQETAHRMTGDLDVSWAVLFVKDNRIVINSAAVTGEKSFVKIRRADLKLNDESVIVDGRIYFREKADIKTELNVTSRRLSARNLQDLSNDLKRVLVGSDQHQPLDESSGSAIPERSSGFSAIGVINVDVKEFLYNPRQTSLSGPVKQFLGKDLSGTITLNPENRITLSIFSGDVCDLQVAGIVGLPPEKTALNFHTRPGSRPQLEGLLDCLGVMDREMSGKYVLDASINGTPGNWTDGYLEFKARKGRMKGLAVISKILTLLNVTELFSINVFKNFFTIGYPYKEMKVSGKIADNILTIDETQIIGEGLDIFFEGTVDLKTTALDMVAYVKPFKMVDSIVTLIPYVGKNLGDGEKSIAFIPFKIKGTVEEPDVFLIFEDKKKAQP